MSALVGFLLMTSFIPLAVDVDGGAALVDSRLDFFLEVELEGLFCLDGV